VSTGRALKLGVPPWHLWGTDATVTLDTLHGLLQVTQQLSRVDYHRPETLRFFMWAKVLDSSGTGGNWTVDARFSLAFGVGRSQVTVPQFVRLELNGTPGATPFGYSSFSPTSLLVDNSTPAPQPVTEFADTVVAEQLNCTCVVNANASAGNLVLSVGSFFAPNVHIRPDWFAELGAIFRRIKGGP